MKRICKKESDWIDNTAVIFAHYLRRGYPTKTLIKSLRRAIVMNREDLLNPPVNITNNSQENNLFMVTTYNPALPNLRQTIDKHWDILELNDSLSHIHQSKLVIGYRRPKNLGDTLVHAELNYFRPTTVDMASLQCKSQGRCRYCPLLNPSGRIESTQTRRKYRSPSHFTCCSNNLIYLITCTVCNKQYVGETKNAIKTRFQGHFYDISRETEAEHPVGIHFNLPGHTRTSMTIQVIQYWKGHPDHTNTTETRREREFEWIHILRTYQPFGLNERA